MPSTEICFGINGWRMAIMESDLTCQARAVAFVLSMHYREGKSCYPSQTVLAEEAAVTPKTVRAALKSLEDCGFIVRKKKKVKSLSFDMTEYEFVGVNTEVSTRVNKDQPQVNTGVNETHEIREYNIKLNTSDKSSVFNKKTFSEDFLNFWKVYPKQRIGNKDKAYAAYCRALKERRATSAELLASAEKYAKSDEVAKGFAKGCAAWLNDDRFAVDYQNNSKQDADAEYWENLHREVAEWEAENERIA